MSCFKTYTWFFKNFQNGLTSSFQSDFSIGFPYMEDSLREFNCTKIWIWSMKHTVNKAFTICHHTHHTTTIIKYKAHNDTCQTWSVIFLPVWQNVASSVVASNSPDTSPRTKWHRVDHLFSKTFLHVWKQSVKKKKKTTLNRHRINKITQKHFQHNCV